MDDSKAVQIDLDALEQAALTATPGPWKVSVTVEQVGGDYKDIIPTSVSCSSFCYGGRPDRVDDADLAFIAAANPAVILELVRRLRAAEADAARYRWLRERDLDTIQNGGVFAGMTPRNVVLNGDDLDAAIDSAMK